MSDRAREGCAAMTFEHEGAGAPTLARGWAATFLAASLALHGAAFVALQRVKPPVDVRSRPVEVEVIETPRPAPPPPPPVQAPPAPEPPRPAPVVRPQRPSRPPPKVARAAPPPSPEAPPPRSESSAPPPPNTPPPANAPTSGPVRYGVAMGSTTTAGGIAAPVGNSLYGQSPARAPDPAIASRPYRAERYTPPTQVSTLPSCACEVPKSEYPPEAAREGREGEVKLRMLVDAEGRVTEVTVLKDPGFGFGAAAVKAAKGFCKCKPATKDGAPVATEISPFTFTFELP